MTEYIEPEDVDDLVERMGLHYRDRNLMLSALGRALPVFGEDVYPTLAEKAAALLIGINHSHPLLDGNKRTSVRVVTAFLRINGYRLAPDSTEDAEEFVVSIAGADPRDNMQASATEWIAQRLQPLIE